MKVLVSAALAREEREQGGAESGSEPYRHRIPLGLLMLSRGWISKAQLTFALDAQKRARQGKLGDWLTRTQGVSEELVAKALAAQWGVPMLPLAAEDADQAARQLSLAHGLLPRLIIDAFGVVPARVAGRKILYLAVEDRVDRRLNTAIEAMTGYRVEPVVAPASALAALRRAVLAVAVLPDAPPAKMYCAPSLAALEGRIADLVAESGPRWSGLVRVREYIWVRMERAIPPVAGDAGEPAPIRVEDAIFALGGEGAGLGRKDSSSRSDPGESG